VHNYVIRPEITLINSYFLVFAKFCGNVRIPQKEANSAAWLSFLWPAENCGP